MLSRLRTHGSTILVALVTSLVTAGAPAIARVVADFARNADRVDGKHAVGAKASVEDRKGKLVATSRKTGLLPSNILGAIDADRLDGKDSGEFLGVSAKAEDSDLLDGLNSDAFYRVKDTVANAEHAQTADQATHAIAADSATNATNASSADTATNAQQLQGQTLANWSVKTLQVRGPLGIDKEVTFTTKGGPILVAYSGSAFRSTNLGGMMGLFALVDNVNYGGSVVWFTNETGSHKAFPTQFLGIRELAAGSHTLLFEPMFHPFCGTGSENTQTPCTQTDGNDFFYVVVMEFPRGTSMEQG